MAIAALIIQGKLPKPDFAVIADTGREKRSTWEYLNQTLQPALTQSGVNVVVVDRAQWATAWCQAGPENCFSTNGDLVIPAFTTENSSTGKLPGYCSKGWKQEPVDRYMSKVHGVTESKRQKWLGFSFDEPTRWTPHLDNKTVWLPLIFGVRLRRHECVKLVEDMGWPKPPRSNCWMCPNQSDSEWMETRWNRPSEFERAVKLEQEIRKVDPNAWLHKQCVPLDQVVFDDGQLDFLTPCSSGECFT